MFNGPNCTPYMRQAGFDVAKALAEIEIRCGQHEMFDPACSTCCFLRKAEHDLQALKNRRSSLIGQIKERLSSRQLVIVDLR